MPRVITALCVRDGSCRVVCPVDCIVPGNPIEAWPTYYIDAETCIDCGACESECPNSAIFEDDSVPLDYTAKGGEVLSMPGGSESFIEAYDGQDHEGNPVHLTATRKLAAGEVIDLTDAIDKNREFFNSGPGYEA